MCCALTDVLRDRIGGTIDTSPSAIELITGGKRRIQRIARRTERIPRKGDAAR